MNQKNIFLSLLFVAFISNGAWIDGNAQDGMRQCLQDEFTAIYVLNLRGNQRTSGELSRKEGGKIFGSGSRTPISITFLVKNPAKQGKATIHYYDIGDYLTREQKLKMVRDFRSVRNVKWEEILSNEKNDWINLRDGVFDTMIPIQPEKKFDRNAHSFFILNSMGIGTSRDSWVYNNSKCSLERNMQYTLLEYRQQIKKVQEYKGEITNIQDIITNDPSKICWSSSLLPKVAKGVQILYDSKAIYDAIYRPFQKMNLYFGEAFIHRRGQYDNLIVKGFENICICVSGEGGSKDKTCFITKLITDLNCLDAGTQCFPLYWYEENKNKQKNLFDNFTEDDYIRHDGITDWILNEVRTRYGTKTITKEMIFYYVYGLLHSKDYRERFAADLKKSLPRIPIVESLNDFMDFYQAGKALADLHLNYETVPPCPEVVEHAASALRGSMDDYDYFRVDPKMRFKSKDDKSTIIYNGNITLTNIPEKAYEYVVNGKSAIEWIVERYCVSTDKKSLIKNDCNDWAREHQKPRYIIDLLLSVINLSVQTVDIVNALPRQNFEDAPL